MNFNFEEVSETLSPEERDHLGSLLDESMRRRRKAEHSQRIALDVLADEASRRRCRSDGEEARGESTAGL